MDRCKTDGPEAGHLFRDIEDTGLELLFCQSHEALRRGELEYSHDVRYSNW